MFTTATDNYLRVSVVVPLFNKADHIRRAINSVLEQSRRPEEVIVIDDGSTDGGDRVVEEYASSVRFIKKPRQGVSAARNCGIDIAHGDFVAFLDADDVWKPHFLERVTVLFKRFPQACAAASAYEWIVKPEHTLQFPFTGVPAHQWEGIIDYFACLAAHWGAPPLHASGVVARRATLKQIGGFPVGIRWGEDHDTWARLALFGDIAFTNEVLFTVNVIASNRATESHNPRPLLPAAATVACALANMKDEKRRRHLAEYLRILVFNSAMINLRYGHSAVARDQLMQHRKLSGVGLRWFVLVCCSFLPNRIVRLLGWLRKVIISCIERPQREQLQRPATCAVRPDL